MDAFFSMIEHNPLAAGFGAIGLAFQLVWPVFRAHRTIMSVQFGIGADYSIHYALLGAWSGAGVAAVGASQTVLALIAGDRPWLRWAGLALLPAVAVICLLTWVGVASLFAFAAVCLIMIGRMLNDTVRLRIMLLAAAPFGMAYDIAVGAWPALIGGIVSAAVAAAMLLREIRERRVCAAAQPRIA